MATAVGTAAVVVGGVAIAGGLPEQNPTPPIDSPTPSPSRVGQVQESAVWSDGKTLHFGAVEVTAPDAIFGFGLVDGGAVYTMDPRNSPVVFQPSDGSDASRIGDNAQLAPVGDPTSGLVSWVEAEGDDGSLVVFDTEANEEVARTSVPPALRPQDNIILPGISPVISVSSTTVYFHGSDETVWVWNWRAGEAPESTGETSDELFDVAGDVTARAGDEESSIDFVSADGNTLATTDSAGGYTALGAPGGYLNPDGNVFASLSIEPEPRLLVFDTRTGETTELVLPGSDGEPVWPFAVGWSGNDTLMVKTILAGAVDAVDLPAQVIACRVSTGDCRVVATVEDGFVVTVP